MITIGGMAMIGWGRLSVIGAVLSALVAPSFVAAASERTDSDSQSVLRRVLTTVRADLKRVSADRFAEATSFADAVGEPFSVELKAWDRFSDVSDSFENGTITLSLETKETRRDPLNPKDVALRMIQIGGTSSNGRPYVASNAFGARAVVTSLNGKGNALAIVGGLSERNFTYAIDATGPEARSLDKNFRVIIEGTLQYLPTGKLANCDTDYVAPELSSPTEITTERCWVGARISRIAFLDRHNGEVLKEWVQ